MSGTLLPDATSSCTRDSSHSFAAGRPCFVERQC